MNIPVTSDSHRIIGIAYEEIARDMNPPGKFHFTPSLYDILLTLSMLRGALRGRFYEFWGFFGGELVKSGKHRPIRRICLDGARKKTVFCICICISV